MKNVLKTYFSIPRIVNTLGTTALMICVGVGNDFAIRLTIILLCLRSILSDFIKFAENELR